MKEYYKQLESVIKSLTDGTKELKTSRFYTTEWNDKVNILKKYFNDFITIYENKKKQNCVTKEVNRKISKHINIEDQEEISNSEDQNLQDFFESIENIGSIIKSAFELLNVFKYVNRHLSTAVQNYTALINTFHLDLITFDQDLHSQNGKKITHPIMSIKQLRLLYRHLRDGANNKSFIAFFQTCKKQQKQIIAASLQTLYNHYAGIYKTNLNRILSEQGYYDEINLLENNKSIDHTKKSIQIISINSEDTNDDYVILYDCIKKTLEIQIQYPLNAHFQEAVRKFLYFIELNCSNMFKNYKYSKIDFFNKQQQISDNSLRFDTTQKHLSNENNSDSKSVKIKNNGNIVPLKQNNKNLIIEENSSDEESSDQQNHPPKINKS